MTISKNIDNEKITLIPEGRIDTATSPEFEACIDEVISSAKLLTIDFAKIEYISSSGLRVLLKAQKAMNAQNGEMIVANANDAVKEVFEVTGFSDILTIQ